MKLYVILEKNKSGGWEPVHGRRSTRSEKQIRVFDNKKTAETSLIRLKAYWHGEYKVASYVEEN